MKMPLSHYSCVLRYEHDIGTEEFLNLGVLFWVPEKRRLTFRHTTRTKRLTAAFPGVDGAEIVTALENLHSALDELSIPAAPAGDLMSLAHRVLPADDSSFKWSSVSTGRAAEPEADLEEIFRRMVARYEEPRKVRVRSDRDLWHALEDRLRPFHVLQHFGQTVLHSPLRPYRFDHTWQNRCPHVVAPVSLDAEAREAIANKATQWLGQALDLSRSAQDFRLHLVLGAPMATNFRAEYESAVALLRAGVSSPRVEVVAEEEAPAFVEKLAHQIRNHQEAG